MSNNRYTVEFAKSGRSACKKCKVKIQKGEIRLGVHGDNGSFEYSHWYHPACFNMPRKLSTGATKISPDDFVADMLEDTTGGDILPSKADEIAQAIATKAGGGKVGKKDAGGDDDGSADPLADLKKAYAKQQKELEDGDEKPLKKAKTEDAKRLEIYSEYRGYKVDELKDMLRWNRQVLTGTKDVLLVKIIDGEMHGRLARCSLCGGRLKLGTDGSIVQCGGSFDEDTQTRIDCAFQCKAADAPRWEPWFTSEPSEEEKEKMDSLEEAAKGGGPSTDSGSDSCVGALVAKAEKLQLELSTKDGIRKAVAGLYDMLSNFEEKTLALPDDPTSAKVKISEVLAVNRDKTAEELVPLLVEQFGFADDKKKKSKLKEAAIEGMVKEPKNAPLVAAFQELSELYYKEGNRNAGSSYTRAVNALKMIPFQITAENAKGLGSGKNKVQNIGKSSADKIYEFVTKGTIEKLEEKRADAA